MVVLLRSGGLKAEKRARISFIIPTMINISAQAPQVQFDRGQGGHVFALKDWPVLSILEKDVCIRVLNGDITFVWVRCYTKEHWDWLSSGDIEGKGGSSNVGPK